MSKISRAKTKKRHHNINSALGLALSAMLLVKPIVTAVAGIQSYPSVRIKPEPPPVIGEMIQKFFNWLYLGMWIVVLGVGIYGAMWWIMGDSEKGKRHLRRAVVGAIVLAVLTVLMLVLLREG